MQFDVMFCIIFIKCFGGMVKSVPIINMLLLLESPYAKTNGLMPKPSSYVHWFRCYGISK